MAKDLKLELVGYDADTFLKRNKDSILGITWQLLKLDLFSEIDIVAHPGLFKLLKEGETLEEFLKLPQDKILLRWMNYHLDKTDYGKKVKNFGKDVKDGTAYTKLLH